jgi:hypothetical protein
MKNIAKLAIYSLTTTLAFVFSEGSALAANNSETSTLTGGQIIGGAALLIAAILVPTMRSARKAKL